MTCQPELIPLIKDACQHIEKYAAKVTNDTHKRRLLRTAIQLERFIAEYTDTSESVV
jgi:hypothetical protein